MADQQRKIEQMAAQLYPDDEVRQAVLDDARRQGTVERIEAGELHLPSPQDALHWHNRLTGRDKMTPEHRAALDRIAELEAEVAANHPAKKGGK